MSGAPRIDFYPSDWITGTEGFSLEQSGAYIQLLARMYDAKASLPFDVPFLARRLRIHWRTLGRVIDELIKLGKLKVREGHLSNDRFELEINRWRARTGQRPDPVAEVLPPIMPGVIPPPGPPARPPQDSGNPLNSNEFENSPLTPLRLPPPIEEESPPTEVVVPLRGADPTHVQVMVRLWNETAYHIGLPLVEMLNGSRQRKARARLREIGGLPGWQDALAKLATDGHAWMRGVNDRGWRANFDFMLQPASFTKLIEGTYDRSKANTTNGAAGGVQHEGPKGPLPKIVRPKAAMGVAD